MMKKNKFIRLCVLTIVLIVNVPLNVFAAEAPGIPDGWTDGYAYVNKVRLHYYRAGESNDKPVIVMVHGVTDNGLCWTTLTWRLQKNYDIYMLDTRGHGLSDPFTSSDNGETLVEDVIGFINKMNFKNPILIGHSMGAATVMRLGAVYPDAAKAIIMLDPAVGRRISTPRPATTPRPANAPANASQKTDFSLAMFGDPEALVKQNNYKYEFILESGIKQNPKWDLVDVKYWALSKKQYHGPYDSEAWQAMSGTMRTEDALSKIKVPGLILKADTSPEGRKANEDAVKDLKNINLVHIDGAGHNLHHDDLNRTEKEIVDFLKKI